MGASRADQKLWKNHHFEVSSHSMKQQTISRSDCDMHWKADCIQQPTMTSSVAGSRRRSAELSKTKLAPKKCSWSLFGGQLPIWSMLSKFRCAVNCNTCSQRWSTERAQLFSTTTPDCMSHNQCFKSWTNWVTRFCLICHIHLLSCQLTTTSSSISTTLCSENASTTSRRRKMLSQSLSNPEGWIFLL